MPLSSTPAIPVCAAVGDGVTDDTAALQAWIDAGRYADAEGRPQGVRLDLPYGSKGVYLVTDTLKIYDVRGLDLIAPPGVRVKWAGGSKPVFWFDHALKCRLQNLIITNPTGTASTAEAVRLTSSTGTHPWISSQCVFDRVSVQNVGGQGFAYGWRLDNYTVFPNMPGAGSNQDQNNELHQLTDCYADDYHTSAVLISGSQIHQIVLTRCTFQGNFYAAPKGVDCVVGSYVLARDCNVGYHSQWDYDFQDFLTYCVVDGGNSEGSNGFVHAGIKQGPIAVRNCRVDGLYLTKKYATDQATAVAFAKANYAIKLEGAGPYVLENIYLGTGVPAWPRVYGGSPNGVASVRVDGVTFLAGGGAAGPPPDKIVLTPDPATGGAVPDGGLYLTNSDAGGAQIYSEVRGKIRYADDVTRGRSVVTLKPSLTPAGAGYTSYTGAADATDTQAAPWLDGTSWAVAFDYQADSPVVGQQFIFSAGFASGTGDWGVGKLVRVASFDGSTVLTESFSPTAPTSYGSAFASSLKPGQWVRVVISYDADAGAITFRLGGAERTGGIGPLAPAAGEAYVAFGPRFNGRVRNAVAWTRALTAAERAALDTPKVGAN